jgi:hypothetical protein
LGAIRVLNQLLQQPQPQTKLLVQLLAKLLSYSGVIQVQHLLCTNQLL